MSAVTREEQILSGQSVLTPVTRKEAFLSAIAGNITPDNLPTPITREEQFLNEAIGGGGTSVENCYVGTATLPETQYDTLAIETGFAPKIVGAWVYDVVNKLNTFSVVYGITTGNQDGEYFQEGGYSRTYTADGTTDVGKGHIVGTSSTGFTVQTCEPYFAGKEIRLIAIG